MTDLRSPLAVTLGIFSQKFGPRKVTPPAPEPHPTLVEVTHCYGSMACDEVLGCSCDCTQCEAWRSL